MQYRRLGRTNLEVSALGFGALEIGRDWGIRVKDDFGRPSERDAIRLVHAALDLGINFFDTAPAYQLSEERLGKALEGRRENVLIATKVGEHFSDEQGFWYDYSAEAVERSIVQSLERLRTDVIDLLQIHSATIEIIEQGEVLEVMSRYQRAGNVRFLGMSGDPDAALAAIRSGMYDTVQVPYNIADQRAQETVFPEAVTREVGVIVMTPLAIGALTDKHAHLGKDQREEKQRAEQLEFLEHRGQTLAQAALRFVLASPTVSTAIAGTRKLEHLRSNAEAVEESLPVEDLERLHELYKQNFQPA